MSRLYYKYYVIITCILLSNCSLLRSDKKDDMKAKRPEHYEQKISGDINATANYVELCRNEFKSCIGKNIRDIALKEFSNANTEDKIQKDAIKCYEEYFQSMKGETNVSKESIKELIKFESERQRLFYEALRIRNQV